MKKKLSFKQWAGAVLILLLFILLTLFLYNYFHEDSRFEKFAREFFVDELSANPLNLHYTLTDPAAYGIDESSLTLPAYHAGQALEDWDGIQETLSLLKKFHPEKMSSANQYTYILFSTYLENRKACAAYPYYEEPLSPVSGIQSELPILLADYRIASTDDIENYLSILTQIPAYLDGIMLYEREKMDYDLFLSDTSIDKVIEQCSLLMNRQELESDTHFLEITFAERLEKLVEQGIMDAGEALKRQGENKRLLLTLVAPAYEKLADELTLLKGNGHNEQGLFYTTGGQEYYQAWLRLSTGSYRSVPEIKAMLAKDFEKNYSSLIALLRAHPALTDTLSTEDTTFPSLTPENMLSVLQTMIAKDYPAIPTSTEQFPHCSIKYINEALAPYSAPAFFLTPPIDDMRENTIYINGLDAAEGLSLFTTLAHEGYPGHLYQTVYSGYHMRSEGAPALRQILNYGGYIEGWAMYVELNSYDYAIRLTKDAHPETESLYLASKLNRQIQLCLYSLLDIIIHYEGASFERVYQILSALGFTHEESARAIYEYIVAEPCNYLKYYLGYLEIEALKDQAKTAWGDNFSLYRFHTFLLNNGPADYRTLGRLLNAALLTGKSR
ncbi:MAG: DUF885 domain-containing protein [Ruminococcus sp.]|nr:DUF885 domain-containing protein [Ruminococcus sp.]